MPSHDERGSRDDAQDDLGTEWDPDEEWDPDAKWDPEEWDPDAEWDPEEWDPDEEDHHEGSAWSTRSRRQRMVLVAGVVAVLACLYGAFRAYTVWAKWDDVESISGLSLEQQQSSRSPQNFLLVGSDSREAVDASDPNSEVFLDGVDDPVGQRADTMVLLRYDPQAEKLDILSIPRDLWVPIAGTDRTERINTAYSSEDGPNRLIDTIQEYFGIPIHHYAEVDFEGFQSLVDVLGGVPMYFDTLYLDENSGFVVNEPGCVELDGQQALAFVRARHLQHMNEQGYWETDPTGDLGRISRQQLFIRRVLEMGRDQLGLRDMLTPGSEAEQLLDVAIEYVRVDEGLELTELAAMGQRYAEFEGESIETHTLAVTELTTSGGAAVLELEQAEAESALNVFRGLPRDHVSPASVDLTVLNGSGEVDQAGMTRDAFEAIGFEVADVGDVSRPAGEVVERTRVRYAPGARDRAELVERHLTAGGELVEDPMLEGAEVVLETGADFTTVEERPRSEPSPTSTTAPGASQPGSSGSSSTTAAPTTTTTVIGHQPGEAPPGVDCG